MGWLGIALAILAIVNIVTGTLINVWSGKETFNGKKMIKGIAKVLSFYVCSAINDAYHSLDHDDVVSS